jgi:hypothetical protein
LQLQQRQNLWNKMTQLGMFEVGDGVADHQLKPTRGLFRGFLCLSSFCRLQAAADAQQTAGLGSHLTCAMHAVVQDPNECLLWTCCVPVVQAAGNHR